MNKATIPTIACVLLIGAFALGQASKVIPDMHKAGLRTPASFGFAYNVGNGANEVEINITAQDKVGNAIKEPLTFMVLLSDDSDGEVLTTTTASGNVTVDANGDDLGYLTAKKAIWLQTDDDGLVELTITDTSSTGFYVCPVLPASGEPYCSRVLTAADYN